MKEPKYITIAEYARRSGLSYNGVKYRIKNDLVETKTIGNVTFIDITDNPIIDSDGNEILDNDERAT